MDVVRIGYLQRRQRPSKAGGIIEMEGKREIGTNNGISFVLDARARERQKEKERE